MTKLTVHPKRAPATADAEPATDPSVADTHKITVRDDRDRVIEIKKLTALDRMRLALAVGAEASENASYMFYANVAASVTSIDSQFVAWSNRTGLEGIVSRLDEDGLAAVLGGWRTAGWISMATPEEAAAEHADAAKN